MRRRKSSFASPSGGCGRGGCSSRRGSIGGATARGTGEGEEEERGLVLRDARGQKGGLVLRDCEKPLTPKELFCVCGIDVTFREKCKNLLRSSIY